MIFSYHVIQIANSSFEEMDSSNVENKYDTFHFDFEINSKLNKHLF